MAASRLRDSQRRRRNSTRKRDPCHSCGAFRSRAHERTDVDWRYGRITDPDLESYLVPLNADSALDIPDYKLDTVGARGIGEIGITGTGAAIANAIFHATGKRVRNVPITPDKLI